MKRASRAQAKPFTRRAGVCTQTDSTQVRSEVLVQIVREAGGILRRFFGRVIHPRQKESTSSVVCDADLAAERHIIGRLQKLFPGDSVLAEESGHAHGSSEFTWVIDPLDGTSNFVAGIPWFGVQVGILRAASPVVAAMYLPLADEFYFAEKGRGAWRNGKRIRVTAERNLQNTLCAFGFDPGTDEATRRETVELLWRVSGGVRNVRTTNSLVDFCFTADGRLGGCINLNTRIWDIVPASLILPEAGGKLTLVSGDELAFCLGEEACDVCYKVLGASSVLYPKLLSLSRQALIPR